MAKFARLLLNKGTVGDGELFKSTAGVTEMTTGKNAFPVGASQMDVYGLHFTPSGDTVCMGYGFDFVGKLAWGRAFAMKGGATNYHFSDLSFAPVGGLSVALFTNSQNQVPSRLYQLRAYLMGVFLDVPRDVLEAEYAKWHTLTPFRPSTIPGTPVCGLAFMKDPPHLAINTTDAKALAGTYQSTISPKFFPPLTVQYDEKTGICAYQLGGIKEPLVGITESGSTLFFKIGGWGVITAERSATGFVLDIGIEYRKV